MKQLADALPDSNAIHGLNVLLTKLKVTRGVKDYGIKEGDLINAVDIALSNTYWNPRRLNARRSANCFAGFGRKSQHGRTSL
ncbi:uncharacterized protein N7518_006654 [Penicillium psychrosexuale]|uniref:uncharacterized protein n=1 Tax=Penicillium psychrosexuale TaxID=1002107 RepID=UPI002544F4B7|nr:uncharacterized protein N7518_006654 [Penicillium psychrosexuale]KAJ5789643.1 hypothetical protein N7518_006654 [Penicillium psychrosexuale]